MSYLLLLFYQGWYPHRAAVTYGMKASFSGLLLHNTVTDVFQTINSDVNVSKGVLCIICVLIWFCTAQLQSLRHWERVFNENSRANIVFLNISFPIPS